MDHLTCDLCGKALLADEPARYELRIQLYAAYDPLELTPEDLERDHRAEIRALLDRLEQMDPQEVEDSVYKEFHFDLCMACQRRYRRDPLPRHDGSGHSEGNGACNAKSSSPS
jgi:hypothetical protein